MTYTRQVHVEITHLVGAAEAIGGIALPPRLAVYCDIDGWPAWFTSLDCYRVTGVCQFNGILYAIARILEMTAADDAEIMVKIRDSWEDFRKVFTGYALGWVAGYQRHKFSRSSSTGKTTR